MTESVRSGWQVLFWLSLAATVYTYFLYPLLLAAVGRLKSDTRDASKNDSEISDNDLPAITMVISAYNEQASLAAKIENCRQLDYPADKLRFLFGSDGSTDKTNAILSRIQDERFRVMISPARSGKVEMLNQLMRQVDTPLVVFSDANTMYEPDAVRRLVTPFSDARTGCVIGKQILYAPDQNACQTEGVYWRYENWIKEKENVLGAVPSVNGSIFAIRRELYGPMPKQTITDDQVLGLKIMSAGWRGCFESKAVCWEPVSTMTDELRRRIRISAGNFQSMVLVPKILDPRSGRVHFAFVSHKLLRWLVPFFLVGMLMSNILLAGVPFYGFTLLLQVVFYTCAMIGVIVPNVTGILKIVLIPKYFLGMNMAILIGLMRFLSGRQSVIWFKAARRQQ